MTDDSPNHPSLSKQHLPWNKPKAWYCLECQVTLRCLILKLRHKGGTFASALRTDKAKCEAHSWHDQYLHNASIAEQPCGCPHVFYAALAPNNGHFPSQWQIHGAVLKTTTGLRGYEETQWCACACRPSWGRRINMTFAAQGLPHNAQFDESHLKIEYVYRMHVEARLFQHSGSNELLLGWRWQSLRFVMDDEVPVCMESLKLCAENQICTLWELRSFPASFYGSFILADACFAFEADAW